MRKLFIVIAISISAFASAQKKDSVLTDSTGLISIKDYEAFVKDVVIELPAKYADVIRQWWIERLRAVIAGKQKKK